MLPANAPLTLRNVSVYFFRFINARKQSERILHYVQPYLVIVIYCWSWGLLSFFRCPSPGRETRKLSQRDRPVPWSVSFAPAFDAIKAQRSKRLIVRNNSLLEPTWLPMCYGFSNVFYCSCLFNQIIHIYFWIREALSCYIH